MKEHGVSGVELNGNIIEVKLKGNFNREGSKVYTDKVKACISQLQGRQFAMLVNDLEVEGGTPGAYQVLNEYNQWLKSQPLCAKAIIINDAVTQQIILQRSPEIAQQNLRFFKSREAGIDWLISQLNQHG